MNDGYLSKNRPDVCPARPPRFGSVRHTISAVERAVIVFAPVLGYGIQCLTTLA